MFVTLITLAITTLIVYVLYTYKKGHYLFEKRGIRYDPGLPLFGNIFNTMFKRRHAVEDIDAVYKAFPDEKYVGYFEGTIPIILIRDPELIRLITVKNFDHFVDHRSFFPEDIEPLFGASLVMMKGDRWRDMRTTLSPAFTSSKMRLMMPLIVDIAKNVVNYLRDFQNEDIDIDDLVHRYSNDVIASTAFGIEVDSLKNKQNEFYKTGQNMLVFSLLQNLCFVLFASYPSIYKKIGMEIFPKKLMNFFKDIVDETMEYRARKGVVRPDMIQLLMDAAKGKLEMEIEDNVNATPADDQFQPRASTRQWSKNELISQVFVFFIAGFESPSTTLIFTVHELAINTEVQDKLYQEIREHNDKNGEINFDTISSLKYLECVVSETLRKWSPALKMDRLCNKAYELPPPREGAQPVKLNPGDIVYNMVNTIHMDPKYYPNPELFDPDRFADDKQNIQPFTFMPFGMGPRNCIGLRFALLQVKVLLYYLMLNFKIKKCPRTEDPIKLKAHNFKIQSQNGCWVQFETRL